MYPLQDSRVLGPLDQMFKPYFWCYLLCFPLTPSSAEFARTILSDALKALAMENPYLTGSVKRTPDNDNNAPNRGQIYLDYDPTAPPKPLRVAFVDLPTASGQKWTATYRQLQALDFPLDQLDSRILAPLTAGLETTTEVMAVQANFLEGGLILAMCFHHSFVDGSGAARVIARLSEHCAAANGSSNSIEDKPVPDSMPDVLTYQDARVNFGFDELGDDEMLWRLNCLAKPDDSSLSDKVAQPWPEVVPALPPLGEPRIVSRMFAISANAFEKIKAAARPRAEGCWVSSNDALVAFLWRHIIRARFPMSNEPGAKEGSHDSGLLPSRAIVALEGRKDLGVPRSYIGNCVFHCSTADMAINSVVGHSTPLSSLAREIRQTVTRTRDARLLKRVIGLAATIPDVSRIRYGNDNLGTDVYTTSWAALPFYDLHWGPALGKMEYLRVPDRHFETLCCILPARKGTTEVIVSMREEDQKRLCEDEEFTACARPV